MSSVTSWCSLNLLGNGVRWRTPGGKRNVQYYIWQKTIWRSLLLNQENLNLNTRDLFLSLLLSTFLSLNCYQCCPLYQTHHHIIIKVGSVLVIPVYDEVPDCHNSLRKGKMLNFQTPTGSGVHDKLILFQSVGQWHIKNPGKKRRTPNLLKYYLEILTLTKSQINTQFVSSFQNICAVSYIGQILWYHIEWTAECNRSGDPFLTKEVCAGYLIPAYKKFRLS